MPHTGKPSGACQQCKKSHVKCDEARPACGKCVRANRICSGYVEGLDLVLRDQNESAKARVNRRQNALRKSKSSTPELQLTFRSPTTLILPSLAESEESHALSFFVSTFVIYPRDTQADRGYLELLPLLFGSLGIGSPLFLALQAMSFVMFNKWGRRQQDARLLSFPHYAAALKATRIVLQDPVESKSDETLMAVCLLGLYEAATSAFNALISTPRHFDGATALIKQRHNGQMTDFAKKMVVGIRSNVVFRAIQFSSPIDKTSGLWGNFGGMPQGPATILDLMLVDVANLLAIAKQTSSQIMELSSDEDEVATDASDLLMRAEAVDSRLASWPDLIPPSWLPVQIPAESLPKSVIAAGLYGDSCDIYPDVMICSAWNEWRVARLRVLSLIAGLGSAETEFQAMQTIQRLVDGICASIPFNFGDRTEPTPIYEAKTIYPSTNDRPTPKGHQSTASAYGGWYSFTPLREACEVGRFLRPGQEDWLRRQLRRLAKMYDVIPH